MKNGQRHNNAMLNFYSIEELAPIFATYNLKWKLYITLLDIVVIEVGV